jgi:hypothetical protein
VAWDTPLPKGYKETPMELVSLDDRRLDQFTCELENNDMRIHAMFPLWAPHPDQYVGMDLRDACLERAITWLELLVAVTRNLHYSDIKFWKVFESGRMFHDMTTRSRIAYRAAERRNVWRDECTRVSEVLTDAFVGLLDYTGSGVTVTAFSRGENPWEDFPIYVNNLGALKKRPRPRMRPHNRPPVVRKRAEAISDTFGQANGPVEVDDIVLSYDDPNPIEGSAYAQIEEWGMRTEAELYQVERQYREAKGRQDRMHRRDYEDEERSTRARVERGNATGSLRDNDDEKDNMVD